METCEYCGKPVTKHILKEGARFHVVSYHNSKFGALSHCSDPDCEINHGRGACVPQETSGETFIRDHIR